MRALGPQAKALLQAARNGDDPSRDDQVRVREAIRRTLLTGAAAAGAAAVAAKSASVSGGASGGGGVAAATATPLGVVSKALLSLTLVGAIGAGTAIGIRSTSPTRPSSATDRVAPPLVASAPRSSVVAPRVVAAPAASASVLPSEPAASAKPVPPPPAVQPSAMAPSPSGHGGAVATSVEAEVLLIGEAHSALRNGDAARALILLDEHSRRYPVGALGEERDAARIATLCALGRSIEARAAADRFLAAFPASPHAPRVRGSCAFASSPTF